MDVKDKSTPEIVQFFASLEELKTIIEGALKERTPHFNGERYLNGNELCDILHIKPRTLQDYRDRNLLGYIQISGKILYKESDVLKLLEDNYYCAIKTY